MRYLNNRTELETAIINDAYGKKMDISANPIQIVPFPGGIQNPGDKKFEDNTLINVCDNSGNSEYKKCYIYDGNDINLQYDHTGIYVASASSVYDYNYDAFNAFNNDGKGWRSSPQWNNTNSGTATTSGAKSINLYKYTDANGNDSTEKYGRPHYGSSFLNSNTTKTTVKYGAGNNGSASSNKTINDSVVAGPTVDIYGEWLQIETPSPVYLYNYSIRVPGPSAGFKDGGDYSTNTYPLDKSSTQNYINNENGPDQKDGFTSIIEGLDGTSECLYNNRPDGEGGCRWGSKLSKQEDVFNSNFSWTMTPDRRLMTPTDRWTSHFPKVFTVVGSTDGKNWYYIDQQSFVDPPDLPKTTQDSYLLSKGNTYTKGYGHEKNTGANIIKFEVNTVDKYSFFRLIISEMFPNNSYVHITTWTLSAFIDNFTPNKRSKEEASYESFTNFRENSQEYVTGMKNWEYFSNDIDSGLLDKYREQKETISQAKKDKNPLSNLEPFSGENADSIKSQIAPITSSYTGYITSQQQINDNYYVMGNNIASFNSLYGNITTRTDDKYDFRGNGFARAPTKIDGWINDNKEIVMQQNSIYILSTITIASLVLALILVTK